MPRWTLPLLAWPGGKYHKARAIASLLPEHSTYVEPFAGGASVFWNKQPSEVEVLGDTAGWLIRFYDGARRGGLRGCKARVASRELFEKLKKCGLKSGSPDLCCVMLANKMSWQGDNEGFVSRNEGKEIGSKTLDGLNNYESRLKHAYLRIADFADTMKRWDSPDTVHYLDPPWVTLKRTKEYSKKYVGGGAEITVERVAKTAAKMKGKVLISYDDSPEARRAFNRADLRVYRPLAARHSGRGGRTVVHELLVTNFELDPRKLRRK